MTSLYPGPDQSTSSPCAIEAIELIFANSRSLPPILPFDLVARKAYSIPYDMLLGAVLAQAEEICALRAKLTRIGQNAEYWCEANGIDDEYTVEDLVSSILDEDQ
jgi:hypothetical protein